MDNSIQLLQRGFIITASEIEENINGKIVVKSGGPLDVSDVIIGMAKYISILKGIVNSNQSSSDATIKQLVKNTMFDPNSTDQKDIDFVNGLIPSMKDKIKNADTDKLDTNTLEVVSYILSAFIRRAGGLYYGKTAYLPDMKRLLYFTHGTGQVADSWKEVWS